MRDAAIRAVVQEAVEREHAALAVVLRAQHEERIFDRDDDGQRPDAERGRAQRVLGPCAEATRKIWSMA